MSGPFKMKGWSGLQKSSAIRQPKNLKTSLANIQKSISNTLEGIGTNIRKHVKPQSESSGFGLTSLEKAQAKKFGMSEWQWKTERNKSGTRANRYARDNQLGKYTKKSEPSVQSPEEIKGIEDDVIETGGKEGADYTWKYQEPTISTPTDDWITRPGDDWLYKKVDGGFQTKKGEEGTVIDVLNPKSRAYRSISEKVYGVIPEGQKSVIEEETKQTKKQKDHHEEMLKRGLQWDPKTKTYKKKEKI